MSVSENLNFDWALIRILNGLRNLLRGLFPSRPFALNFVSLLNCFDNKPHIFSAANYSQSLQCGFWLAVVNFKNKVARKISRSQKKSILSN